MNVLEVRRLGLRVGKILRSRLSKPTKKYLHDRVTEYGKIWAHAAEACGATLTQIAPDVWRAERDGVPVYLRNNDVQLDDYVILTIAGRKPLVHRLLRNAGLAVPDHAVFELHDLEPAMEFLSRHPDGVVVKPANETHAGDGVSTHLRTHGQVKRAAILASLYDSEILIERMVPGECYRALVVEGRMVHAVCRRGPRATGNGRSTVRALIAAANTARLARRESAIPLDEDCLFTLKRQGLTPDSVVPEGTTVLLRAVEYSDGGHREIRTVYNSVVTDLLHDSIRADVEEAARLLGSDFLGVDLIMTDPGRPLAETGGCINEVNTTPALHHHYDDNTEEYPAVAATVLDLSLRRRALRERQHAP